MSRSIALALLFGSVVLAPRLAKAAGDCPDGWFCEDGAAPQAPPTVPPPNGERPPSAPPSPNAPPGQLTPPPYPPPEDQTIFLDRPEDAPPPPVKRRRQAYREWGFNLHLEDAIIGNKTGKASNAGMGGVGFGFRYRPIPHVAFEAGLDLLTGTDFNGNSRDEGALLLNTLVFFNPRDLVQFYALGGLGFSAASVKIGGQDQNYDYFGGQLGLGLEVRVTRNIALGGDVVGFVRGRTDDRADRDPEFVDPTTHRATNTSGGGLIRIGATFYW